MPVARYSGLRGASSDDLGTRLAADAVAGAESAVKSLRVQDTVDMPCLVPCFAAVLTDMRSKRVYPMAEGAALIAGRSDGCGLLLEDASVSRIHARILCEGGSVMVEDLGSTNGTFVDGAILAPFERTRAPFGSVIRLGAAFLRVGEGGRHFCAQDGSPMGCKRGGLSARKAASNI